MLNKDDCHLIYMRALAQKESYFNTIICFHKRETLIKIFEDELLYKKDYNSIEKDLLFKLLKFKLISKKLFLKIYEKYNSEVIKFLKSNQRLLYEFYIDGYAIPTSLFRYVIQNQIKGSFKLLITDQDLIYRNNEIIFTTEELFETMFKYLKINKDEAVSFINEQLESIIEKIKTDYNCFSDFMKKIVYMHSYMDDEEGYMRNIYENNKLHLTGIYRIFEGYVVNYKSEIDTLTEIIDKFNLLEHSFFKRLVVEISL